MIGDIALGRFVPIDSPIHRLDPRTKLMCTVAVTLALFAGGNVAAFVTCGVFAALSTLLSRVPAAILLRSLRPFLWLFLFTLVLHAALTPGHVVWHVKFFEISLTEEGIRRGLLFSMRLAIAISLATLLTLTTAPMELTDALERLLRPLRRLGFPSHEFAMMVTIAIRFIPVLLDEASRLQRAQLARGADFGGGPVRRARMLVPLVVPLFISAFDRADRLALAMESRAYRGGAGRTSYRELEFRRGDLGAVAAAIVSILLVLALR